MRKNTLRQQLFHKNFANHVVILITHREHVKREAEAVHEVDISRLTRSQKTNNVTHVRQSRSNKNLNSMHYTENFHLSVSSPELFFLNYNQLEGNLNFNMNEAPLPTHVEMNAVTPLEGKNLMYFP